MTGAVGQAGRHRRPARRAAAPARRAAATARRAAATGRYRRSFRRAAAAALALAALLGLPAAAQAGWGRPFSLARPQSSDLLAAQLALSAGGSAAAAFGTQDVDSAGSARALVTLRSARGATSTPRRIAGAAQVLALAYDAGTLELLTGASSAGLTCCSSAQVVAVDAGGRVGAPRPLITTLTGATQGRLLTLGDSRMLAAVATERGVWVTQSTRADRFTRPLLLTRSGELPQALAAAPLGTDGSIVAWTAGTGLPGTATADRVYYALGSKAGPPLRVHTAATVPAGHQIDELAVAPHGAGATAAWVESWYDGSGDYHSQVRVADLGAHPVVRSLSPGGRLASGLTLAGDPAGGQAAAWASCTADGTCVTQVVGRPARGRFGAARTLGSLDPTQVPALAVGPTGQTVVGWVSGGRPLAVVARAAGAAFGAPVALTASPYALDLTVAAGPRGRAMAAWTQGTVNASLVGAAFTP